MEGKTLYFFCPQEKDARVRMYKRVCVCVEVAKAAFDTQPLWPTHTTEFTPSGSVYVCVYEGS